MPSVAEVKALMRSQQNALFFNDLRNLEDGVKRKAIEWDEEPPPEECEAVQPEGEPDPDAEPEDQDGEPEDDALSEDGDGDGGSGDGDDESERDSDGDGQSDDGSPSSNASISEILDHAKEKEAEQQEDQSDGDDEAESGVKKEFTGWEQGQNVNELHAHGFKPTRWDGQVLAHAYSMPNLITMRDTFGDFHYVYEIECVCGWTSAQYRSATAAEAEAHRHLMSMAGYVK